MLNIATGRNAGCSLQGVQTIKLSAFNSILLNFRSINLLLLQCNASQALITALSQLWENGHFSCLKYKHSAISLASGVSYL